MQQLPGVLIYLSLAAIVPVMLARFVIRAEWRIIGVACAIWYGFLVLAFGGLMSQDGFGWALIFAMFFSIPAVPVLAVVLRIWTRLSQAGTPRQDDATDGGIRSFFRFPHMSQAQWGTSILLIVGIILFAWFQDQRDLKARAEVLRPYFQLPQTVAFDEIRRISKSSVTRPHVEAIVRFTEPQFKTYVATLISGESRRSTDLHYDGAPLNSISETAFYWHDWPGPKAAGNRRVTWYRLSGAETAKIRNGKVLCVALQKSRAENSDPQSRRQAPRHSARACSELDRAEYAVTCVLGALDYETRSLHMIMN